MFSLEGLSEIKEKANLYSWYLNQTQMFFKRITFSFFVCKKTATLLKYHLSSPRVQHLEKKQITEAQHILGVVALFLTL